MTPEEMKQFVSSHFQSLINERDTSVIERNVRKDYIDHNGPGDQQTGIDESRKRTASNLERLQGLSVEIRDILADGDKVVVRNVWTAFDPDRATKIEMHGFVLFRIEQGQLAERWATVTEAVPLHSDSFDW